ncbi:MAG TPA: DUF188 domain-containing protein [Desulfobacter sp.]|nr:DUF188 domain-containing protein [Desulfobacter sp.]
MFHLDAAGSCSGMLPDTLAPRMKQKGFILRGLTLWIKGEYMKIWVDADACPAVVKNILFKAADRTRVEQTMVANHPMKIPQRNYITFLQVASGFDEADNRILEQLGKGDLVITADILLAVQVLEKEGGCP